MIVLASLALLLGAALLLQTGCPQPLGERGRDQAGWQIQLNVQPPVSTMAIEVSEYEVTGLLIELRDPLGELLRTIEWDATEGPRSYTIAVQERAQYQISVTHYGEKDGRTVKATESAAFNIQAMRITVINVVPGAIGVIGGDPGEYELTPLVELSDAGEVSGAESCPVGQVIQLTATANGGVFVKWTNEDGERFSDVPDISFIMPAQDVVLYAIWTTGTDVIGKVRPAGAWIFCMDEDDQYDWTFLEAAPASTEWPSQPWGGYGYAVGPSAQGQTIGTGAANTQAIVAAYGDNEPFRDRDDYAAKLCWDLDYGGETDWFLPSLDELDMMFRNLHLQEVGGFRSGTGNSYWSSSELLSLSAWWQNFDDGRQGRIAKGSGSRVRAARAF